MKALRIIVPVYLLFSVFGSLLVSELNVPALAMYDLLQRFVICFSFFIVAGSIPLIVTLATFIALSLLFKNN